MHIVSCLIHCAFTCMRCRKSFGRMICLIIDAEPLHSVDLDVRALHALQDVFEEGKLPDY